MARGAMRISQRGPAAIALAMADFFTGSPRRVNALIRLHPAEIAAVVAHPDILAAMTEAELRNIAEAVGEELKQRPAPQEAA